MLATRITRITEKKNITITKLILARYLHFARNVKCFFFFLQFFLFFERQEQRRRQRRLLGATLNSKLHCRGIWNWESVRFGRLSELLAEVAGHPKCPEIQILSCLGRELRCRCRCRELQLRAIERDGEWVGKGQEDEAATAAATVLCIFVSLGVCLHLLHADASEKGPGIRESAFCIVTLPIKSANEGRGGGGGREVGGETQNEETSKQKRKKNQRGEREQSSCIGGSTQMSFYAAIESNFSLLVHFPVDPDSSRRILLLEMKKREPLKALT